MGYVLLPHIQLERGLRTKLYSRPGFPNFSGSGSGFQISLDPETDPVSVQILEQKKEGRKVSKSDLSEENLKIMTKNLQKMKKATTPYKKHHN